MSSSAAMSTKDMDGFTELLAKPTDMKQKLVVGQDMLRYLQEGNSIECQDIGMVVDLILPWIQSSNFKVSYIGLDLMTELSRRMESYFKPYIPSVLPSVIDRLGDSKDMVRERCQLLLMTIMEVSVVNPQQLFDRLAPAFAHRNSNVRDEAMKCLCTTLNQHGANCLSVSRLVPSIVKLLSDPNAAVRDSAISTLANIYRHVGEKLRIDLLKKQLLPQAKIPILMAKFDEIKSAGDFFPTAQNNTNLLEEDEPDRSVPSSAKRTPSVNLRRNASLSAKPSCLPTGAVGNSVSFTPVNSGAPAAGALDEDGFIKAFEAVPAVQIFSSKDLEDQMNKVRNIIADTSLDWSKRVDAIRKVRSLLIAGANDYDEFYLHLRQLDPAFQASVKDLRSQVVREACVTIAFLASKLGSRFELFAENMIPCLINLIQNSAKIIASAGQVAVGFIVRHTHSSRLIPHICAGMAHKSREIRRAVIKAIHQLISSWPFPPLQKQLNHIQNSLTSAITDADQEVRLTARKAYWAFKDHFPDQADALLNALDTTYKRSLHSDMSNSSSSNSLHQPSSASSRERMRPPTEFSSARKVLIPVTPASRRSNSAVDLQAAQRAKARAQYAALARQKVGSNASLPRPKKTTSDGPTSLTGTQMSPFSPEHSRQARSRSTRVSQSTPSSRSGSPSSRLNYATFASTAERSRRSPSYTGSRSGAASRETSPARYHHPPLGGGIPRSVRGTSAPTSRSATVTSRPPVLAQRMLYQSQEAESALADALGECRSDPNTITSPRRTVRALEDHSDDSETSSVCSERSFESSAHRRPSDSYSWSGSQSRLYRDIWEPGLKDITEIMHACESTHWSDRKDGLVSLSAYLQAGNTLTPHQLTRITDNFTKMLSDSHTKVFSLFLDTVADLISTHAADLHPWLYILLTRLFNKLGSDLLTSIQAKINRTLDAVREAFGPEAMVHWALKFLVDPTQTPNTRVKLAVLQFLARTAPGADPTTAFPPSSSERDPTALALTKMIGWTMGDSIKQGSELRRAAQEAILALFNLNTPFVTLRFAQLPKEYQEAAATLIQGRVRKMSVSSPSNDPTVCVRQEPLSPDQVYRSLRKTTAEIQSYSFDGKVADTASHDSGISQMSLNDVKQELDTISNWTASLSVSSPTKDSKDCNGLDAPNGISNGSSENGNSSATQNGDKSELEKTLDTIESLNGEEMKLALSLLAMQVKEADPVVISNHFRRVLRIILPMVVKGDEECREASLSALCEMLKKRTLGSLLQSYTELILINVLKTFSDSNRELAKQAEPCVEEIAHALKPDIVIKVLIPLMTADPFPMNLAVIKTLTKVVEAQSKHNIMPMLPQIMPALVQAYGHEESLVRKSAVFCMVALHDRAGDAALRPYLSMLSPSKLKLLELYINKKHTPSVPNSPKV